MMETTTVTDWTWQTDDVLRNVLSKVCRLANPKYNFIVRISPTEALQPGDVFFAGSGSGRIANWKFQASRLVTTLQNQLDFKTFIDVPSGYDGEVIVKLEDRHLERKEIQEEIEIHWDIAPWFTSWLFDTVLFDSSTKAILKKLNTVWVSRWGRWVYRGEPEIYPSVTSSLARYWDIHDPEAIRSILTTYHQKAKRVAQDVSMLDVETVIQQLGGKTNHIDFSLSVWVALWFACQPSSSKTGRVWGLDTVNKKRITLHKSEDLKNEIAKNRLQHQLGVLVSVPDGKLSGSEVDELIRIEDKTNLLKVLESWGINREYLFPDIISYIQYNQDDIPFEAWVRALLNDIRHGRYERVGNWSEGQIKDWDREVDDIQKTTALYLHGLICSLNGIPKQGLAEIRQAAGLFDKQVPNDIKKNIRAVTAVCRGNDVSRLHKKLKLNPDPKFWSRSLTGYRVKTG